MSDDDVKITMLDISSIIRDENQPRKTFNDEKIKELSASILKHGLLQPILVEKTPSGKYKIISGERRFRACHEAKIKKIPAIIKQLEISEKMQIAIIENIQRENLNAIEEAESYLYLMKNANMTEEEISKGVGKSRSAISNSIRLLTLSKDIQDALKAKKITKSQAKALLSVIREEERKYLFEETIKNSLSVRDIIYYAEQLNRGLKININKDLRRLHAKSVNLIKNSDVNSDDLLYMKIIEDKLSTLIGKRVKLKGGPSYGKISLSYCSFAELEQIYKSLGGKEKLVEDEEE